MILLGLRLYEGCEYGEHHCCTTIYIIALRRFFDTMYFHMKNLAAETEEEAAKCKEGEGGVGHETRPSRAAFKSHRN